MLIKINKSGIIWLALATVLMIGTRATVCAQTIKVAAAANLQSVINVLGDDFKQQTGISIEPIVSSSGKLVAQISNGAPYDIFLSADMEFPQKLATDGFAEKPPIVYALGSLIICSSQNINLKNWDKLLLTDQVKKIAIANAATAPYGRAAEESLKKMDLLDKVKDKMVYGESISQVNTYIVTGVATVGFTSQSLVMDPSNHSAMQWQLVDPKTYTPIQQGMVLIKQKPGPNAKAAAAFFKYMQSGSAKSILKRYGYLIP
jgi:molybdate transport system substrate-binding protein